MNKISKFIICCIAVIMSIVSLCVPTYCLDEIPQNAYDIQYYQNIDNSFNFYNYSNLSNVYYTNFNLTFSNSYGFTFFNSSGFNDLHISPGTHTIPVSFAEWKVYCFNQHIGSINGTFTVYVSDDKTRISVTSRNLSFVQIPNIKINPIDYGLGGISFDYLPYFFLYEYCGMTSFKQFYLDQSSVSVSFDIEYNGNTYLNNYFGLVSNIKPFVSNVYLDNGYSNYNHNVYSRFNYTNTYASSTNSNLIYSDFVKPQNSWFNIINNEFNSDNDYVNSYTTALFYNTTGFVISGNTQLSFENSYFQVNLFLNYNYDNDKFVYLYSSNVDQNSVIIPNGSNDFYKTAEWWDIPTHLYNFFVYIIFDAPIISNFTKLVYVLINFIVELFEFFIGLFTGFENLFFISIFIGIIVLIFLLKIIFKG